MRIHRYRADTGGRSLLAPVGVGNTRSVDRGRAVRLGVLGAVLAGTVGSVWWVPRTSLIERAWLPFCVLALAWAGWFLLRRHWMVTVLLVGAVVGYGAFGLYQAYLGSPSFTPVFTASPVEVFEIADMSRFRSCAGGDFSGRSADSARDTETDRSMLHQVLLRDTFGSGRQVEVYAVADGVITEAQDFQLPTDLQLGTGFTYLGNFASEIELTVYRAAPLGQWVVQYQHVFPTVGEGDHVKAGDVIGYAPPSDWVNVVTENGNQTDFSARGIWFDVVVGWKPYLGLTGLHYASYVRYLSPELQKAYFDAGYDPTKVALSRDERDAAPCGGVFNQNLEADYVNGGVGR